MTKTELFSEIFSNYTDAIQIDTSEFVIPVDGEFLSVSVGKKSTKDTKRSKAFDLEKALADWAVKQDNANKPRKKKEDDPEVIAAKETFRADVIDCVNTMGDDGATAQEVAAMFPPEREISWQKVSAVLKALVNDGVAEKIDKSGKAGYKML
jgi:hypothetical protein